jgi:hypothetical protein
MMFSLAWRCNSFTQALALSSELYTNDVSPVARLAAYPSSYGLCDVVYDDCAICVPVIHGSQRFVSFLPRCVPNLKLYGCLFVECNSLSQECGSNCGFSVVIELILCDSYQRTALGERSWQPGQCCHTLTNRSTNELFPTADSPAHHQLELRVGANSVTNPVARA